MSDEATPVPDLKKGRPTPKRREAQRRRGPVPPPPTTRREAAQRQRAEQLAARKGGRRPSSGADDADLLLKRDRGPVRALVRDVVDARRNVGVLLLPFAIAVVLAQLTSNAVIVTAVLRVYPVTLILVIVDSLLLSRQVAKAVRASYPDDATSTLRHAGYAVLRSTVFRRFRMPKPRVAAAPLLPRRKR